MNYKIAVCDDSAADRQYLSALTAQWADRAGAGDRGDGVSLSGKFPVLLCGEERL